MNRWCCDTCEQIVLDEELLRAPSPFNPDDTVIGCPKCESIEGFTEMCDVTDCKKPASMGSPTPEGYKRTCWEHRP